MAKKIFMTLKQDVLFYVFTVVSLLLIIVSFVLPPLGVIDSSVFAGVGEIFAFASLGEVSRAISAGMSAKVQHNVTSVSITANEHDEETPVDELPA